MQEVSLPPPTFNNIFRLLQEVATSQKETDLKFKDTDSKIKEISTQIDRLSNRLDNFIEEAVRTAAARLFHKFDVHQVHQNIIAKRDRKSLI